MKTDKELQQYASQLLNVPDLSSDFLHDVWIVKVALIAYRLGLEGKPFEWEILLRELPIEKEIPAQFHTLVAQLATIISRDAKGIARDYIIKETAKTLEEYQNYFTTKSPTSKNY